MSDIVKADALRAPFSQGLSAYFGDASRPEILVMLIAQKKTLEMMEAQAAEKANLKRRQAASALEEEFSTAMTGHMDLLRQQRDALGDSWPESLYFTLSAVEGQPAAAAAAKAAMRVDSAASLVKAARIMGDAGSHSQGMLSVVGSTGTLGFLEKGPRHAQGARLAAAWRGSQLSRRLLHQAVGGARKGV